MSVQPLEVGGSVAEGRASKSEALAFALGVARKVWKCVGWPLLPTLLFAVSLAWVMSHHEMWHDELQVWGLARESQSAVELMHNLRYESSPPLWHLLVYASSQFVSDPRVMQVMHATAATLAVLILLTRAPFSRLQRVLLATGYFTFFEYGVISRSYVFGELFLFGFLALFPWTRWRGVFAGIAILLMAGTSFFGVVLGLACTIAMILQNGRIGALRPSNQKLVTGLGIAGIGLLVAAYFVRQQPDSSIHTHWDFLNFHGALRTAALPYRTLIAIPAWRNQFWNSNMLDGFEVFYQTAKVSALVPQAILGACVFIAILWLLRRQRVALAFYLGIALPCLAFFYVKKFGYVRHHGHLYLAFVGAVWIMGACAIELRRRSGQGLDDARRSWQTPWVSRVLTLVLLINVAGALMASAHEVRGTFAANEAAAEWIKAHGYVDRVVVGPPSLAAWLDRDVYLIPNQRMGRFIYYRMPWTKPNPADLPALAERLEREHGKRPLFVLETNPDLNITTETEVPGFARLMSWADCMVPRGGILILEPLASSEARGALD